MLQTLKHKVTIFTGKVLLNINDAREIDAGKRLISIIAGAYIFQRGLRIAPKSPILAFQEVLLGGFLLYNGATGVNLLNFRKPRELADMRKNQIQGNDPDADPAFV